MMYADAEDVRLVILVEQAERLKETLPDLVVPLTRLADSELVRASLGAAPDPYFIDIPRRRKKVSIFHQSHV